MPDSMANIFHQLSIWFLPVIIAITFHEAAHGYVAWRLGDDTAKQEGRVTFLPWKHIDLVGTIILPAVLLLTRAPFLFGWAKPVPVDFENLQNPKRDMVWVAAAGPGINLVLAIVSAALLHIVPLLPTDIEAWVARNLINSVVINLVLAVFNMLPLPPLDGGRVAVGLLPLALARPLARLERIGLLIVILVLFVVPWAGRHIALDIDILGWLVGRPVEFLYRTLMTVVGPGP
ncbi:MAG: Zn-dependent protease [Alphaproteobacteria bacterium]|jgi:Zn-dependent protease